MNRTVFILGVVLSLFISTSCACNHKWSEPNCSTPKTCSVCGKIEDITGEHVWEEATCQKPKTCVICKTTDGDPQKHVEGSSVIVKEATPQTTGLKETSCALCLEVIKSETLYYYDYNADDIAVYSNILDTINSLKKIHMNPNSIILLGAVVMNPQSDNPRTIVYISYKGVDEKEYTHYFWKDINAPDIKDVYAKDCYTGHNGRMPIEQVNLDILKYFDACGLYVPNLSSAGSIFISTIK